MLRRLMMIFLGSLILLSLLGAFLGCVVVRPILFPVPQSVGVPTPPVAKGGRLIEVESGRRLSRGFLIEPEQRSDRLLVVFHGNGATIDGDLDLGLLFAARRWNVLLVEYPGYGISSDSSPSESRIYTDAEALIIHVQSEMGIRVNRTAALAHSLGTAVAIEMASRQLVSRLALFSPLTSTAEVGAFHFMPAGLKWLPYVIVCDRFYSLSKAPSLTLPVLIFHGRYDTVIPFSMGEELSDAFADARFVAVESNHNDIFYRLPASEWKRLDDFLAR